MKPILAFLFLLVTTAYAAAQAPEATVATLPPASTTSRQNYRVTDSLVLGDCTQGGGTKRTICTSNGSIWISVTSVPDKIDVGLPNVDNTSDANKPVSTATQTALNLKANTASLSTVATSGAYADLTGKPSLAPSATTDTTNPANITQSSSFRFTTDTEKSTWNGKENALTFTSPILRSVNTITCQVASGSLAGCLSISDWTNFNGKQAALGFTPLNPANNLSELTAATARTNLGLGTLATQSGTFSGTSSGTNTGDETTATIISKLGLPVGVSISAVQAITIADNGAGSNAAYTYTPSLAFNVLARFTCNDAQGCTITIAETNGFDNQSVVIVNAGTASVIVQDQATVSETSGNFTLGQHDALVMKYSSDRYLEVSRSNN